MVRRVVSIAVGVGAILAGSAGLAHAANVVQPDKVSAPGLCAWSTHWQTGQCVDAETPAISLETLDPQKFGVARVLSFWCPAEYPFPFEGAFSGNPTWLDRSYQGSAVVKAVADNGLPNQRDFLDQHLSYTGGRDAAGRILPGYVTVLANRNMTNSEDAFAQGRYQCSDTPANPR